MTLEEAKALVLREGMMTEPDLSDAVPLVLYQGDSPTSEKMEHLVEAVDIVHEAIEEEPTVDRKLAGALWIIGVEASNAIGKKWQPQEERDIVALWEAVESALVGFWPVEHPKDKEGAENGDGTAGKTKR